MKWVISFVAICTGIIAVILLGLWAFGVFGALDLSVHGTIAMILGITLTVVLGAGLMALVFFSDRSRHDELVSHDPPPRPDH